jgi:hypothetical protein
MKQTKLVTYSNFSKKRLKENKLTLKTNQGSSLGILIKFGNPSLETQSTYI